MFWGDHSGTLIWWVLGFMLIMAVFCFFMMRGCSCMGWRHRGTWGFWGKDENPEDILKRRYAIGEISEEEFEQMKQRLKE